MGTAGVAGKVVVITGASSGIGESTAKLLAREGARVVLGARRKERIDALTKEITDSGGKAVPVVADVSRRNDVDDLVKRALDTFERVDVLVNNAGIMPIAPVQALKVNEWDRMIDVNVKGLLYAVAAVLPSMQRQKSGHIVNIASVGGIKAFAPGGAVYSATKSAVRMLTEGLRMELHAQNIRCTAISPGAVATELPEGSSEEATRKNLREFYKVAIPAGAIAGAIAYAISQPPEVEIDEMVIRPTAQDF
ncbi:MAG TPA: SDR family oxidoreductase [Polyangia bacterium]